MLTRSRRRRWLMGLSTVLGVNPQGFFLPYRYAGSVKPLAYPGLEPLFEASTPAFETELAAIERYGAEFLAFPHQKSGARFDQSWFPGLDALIAYAIVRERRPLRIVEIGSGHSTRFMAAGVIDGGLETDLVCIDPAPRASLERLNVRWRSSILQNAPIGDLEALEAGDLLFVDSSHLLMPGTDVDYLIGHVLPGLKSGVYLHIHDIFLPDPYPESWTWRGYNEQSAVAALIQGGGYDLVFSSRYASTRMADRLTGGVFKALDISSTGLQSSLWLQKR